MPEEPSTPDAPTPTRGLWFVSTRHSGYVLDLEHPTLIRIPGPLIRGEAAASAANLRRDGEPIPLLGIHHFRLGEPLVMTIQVRTDAIPTLRTTTPVTYLEEIGRPPAIDDPAAVRHISPGMSGRWLVSTLTSDHDWDLDNHLYTRHPTREAPGMRHDNLPQTLEAVHIWPLVGFVSILSITDPRRRGRAHQVRTAQILSILPLPRGGA